MRHGGAENLATEQLASNPERRFADAAGPQPGPEFGVHITPAIGQREVSDRGRERQQARRETGSYERIQSDTHDQSADREPEDRAGDLCDPEQEFLGQGSPAPVVYRALFPGLLEFRREGGPDVGMGEAE